MTVDAFKEMMVYNEPDFEYNGRGYSICCPNGKYYVTASDSPGDIDLEFDSLAIMMMSMELEDAFDFKFTEFVKFETVGDVCKYVEEKVAVTK